MENETQTLPAADMQEMQARYLWLRKQIVTILVLLIIISGTLNIYLLRQSRYASNDLKMIRSQAARIIPRYTKVRGPAMDNMVSKLTDYAKTHPDFAPILAKYGVNVTSNAPAPAGPASTSPVPPQGVPFPKK